MTKRLPTLTILLGNIILIAGLALLAYLGVYNRYWGDDWCYNRDFKNHGVIKTTEFYFAKGEDALIHGYSINRYSLSYFGGLIYTMGLPGTQGLAAITILTWLASMYWVLINLTKILQWDIPKNVILLGISFLLFYNLYISTDRFQILYWRSGVLPYSFAIIFGLITVGLITNQVVSERSSILYNFLIAATAFIAGGFSEIGSVYVFSCISLILLIAWRGKYSGDLWAKRMVIPALTACVSLFFSMIVLIISPSNTARMGLINPIRQPLLTPIKSFQNALGFIIHSLTSLPLPHLIIFSFIVGLSILHYMDKNNRNTINTNSLILTISIISLATFLLIAAIQAPTTYLYNSPPDPRGQSLSRFTLTIALGLIAWLTGLIISQHIPKKMIALPIFLLIIGLGYTLRAASVIYQEYPGFVSRAQQWDRRDLLMKDARANGFTRIEVPLIDTHDIGTKDIMRSRDVDKWLHVCVSEYYGFEAVKSISK